MNDHETLRLDPLLASVVGSRDPQGRGRKRERDLDKPLAAPSRVHRLELSHPDLAEGDRYRRIALEPQKVDELLVDTLPPSPRGAARVGRARPRRHRRPAAR